MTRADAIREASRPLFEEMALKPGDVFTLRSRSRDGLTYEMTVTPEGFVVHQGEGCEGEQFSGVRGCYHSKEMEKNVTNSLVPYEAMVPQRIEFSNDQLDTIAKVICVDTEGRIAPPAFVQLFVAACRHTGLDPFLRQIYALSIRGKWTMFVGIDGYRVISERTGLDQGMDGPQWSDDGQTWYDFPFSDSPAFCRVGIWRKDVPRAFIAVCSMKAKINPASDSWKKDAPGMLAKCAEALARRRAFPADMAVIPNEAVFDDTEGEPQWSVSEAPRQSLANRTGHEVYNGEVVSHEAPRGSKFSPNALPDEHEATQETPVSASGGTAGHSAVSTSPAPSPSLMDEEQHAKVIEWVETIKDRHGAKPITQTGDWLKAAFPYCVGDNNGWPNIGALTQTDAASYIRLLRHVAASKDGAVPADGAEPEHEWIVPDDSADPICSVCNLAYVEPGQAALPV